MFAFPIFFLHLEEVVDAEYNRDDNVYKYLGAE